MKTSRLSAIATFIVAASLLCTPAARADNAPQSVGWTHAIIPDAKHFKELSCANDDSEIDYAQDDTIYTYITGNEGKSLTVTYEQGTTKSAFTIEALDGKPLKGRVLVAENIALYVDVLNALDKPGIITTPHTKQTDPAVIQDVLNWLGERLDATQAGCQTLRDLAGGAPLAEGVDPSYRPKRSATKPNFPSQVWKKDI